MYRYGVTSFDPSASTIGRPRNPKVEQVVFDAVLDLIGEGSTLTSLSLVTIARRGCISRNSLYRRWTTKEELYLDVVKSLERPVFEIAEQADIQSGNFSKLLLDGHQIQKRLRWMLVGAVTGVYHRHRRNL